MSDEHRGLPHDMPEYVPNWPVPPVKVKARVYRHCDRLWYWGHNCPRGQGLARTIALGRPKATQAEAFAAALKHARGCW